MNSLLIPIYSLKTFTPTNQLLFYVFIDVPDISSFCNNILIYCAVGDHAESCSIFLFSLYISQATGAGAGSLQDRLNDPEAAAEADEEQAKEKERKVEEDDEKTLKDAREWDDWRDGKEQCCFQTQSEILFLFNC